MLLLLMGTVLPDPSDVPVLEAEGSITVYPVDGRAWFRVLERDYALLNLEVSPRTRLTAFADNGSVIAPSLNGRMVLSAYSAYWFWIMAETEEPVTAALRRRHPAPVTLPHSGRVDAGAMALTFAVSPDRDGRYLIRLTGTGGADLDMEVYGAGNRLWAGSYSPDGNEKVVLDLLSSDTVTVLVSRYSKGGSGEFNLDMERLGDFRRLEGSVSMVSRPDRIERFLVPPASRASLLHLSFQGDDDLDLFVRGPDQRTLWSSTTYFSSEMILLPAGDGVMVAEVVNYPGEDGENPVFVLSVNEPDTVVTSEKGVLSLHSSPGSAPLVGYSPGAEGFYRVASLFEKTRSGTLRLFRESGEPAVLMATRRGDEEFLAWIGAGDTVWVAPGFSSVELEGSVCITLEPGTFQRIEQRAHREVDTHGSMTDYFLVSSEGESILLIRLTGEPRELDMDMLVSGPGYDLQAQGGESLTDSASDEAVAVYSSTPALFGVTVYSYERRARGEYTLTTERIPVQPPAPGTPEPETWALLVGISGYPDQVDVLSRCTMDAMDMRDFLLDQGVPEDQMVILVDRMATVDAFCAALEELLERAGPEDRLVVFFSGHGVRLAPGSGGPEEPDGRNEALCFIDGNIEDDLLAEMLSGFEGLTMLFIDACHSGGFVHDFGPADNILVLTAAREDLVVSERILTPILLRGSRGEADTDGDGVITAGELADYVAMVLQRVCPFCDTILGEGPSMLCTGCGEVLKGENRIPRPQQGLFTQPDRVVWTVNGKAESP